MATCSLRPNGQFGPIKPLKRLLTDVVRRLAQSDRLFRGMFEEGEVADVRFPQFAALAAGRRQSDDNEDLGPFVDGGEVGWEMES